MLQTVAGALIEALEKTGVTHTGAALAAAGQARLTGRLGVSCGTARALALGICCRAPWRLTPTIASTCLT